MWGTNPLFFKENNQQMLFGDAKASVDAILKPCDLF